MLRNRKEVGTVWERKAAEYLEAHGMKIRERNFRCRQGEIDLIGSHEGYLVFVEVKYRAFFSAMRKSAPVTFSHQKHTETT